MSESLKELVRKITELPTLPAIAQQIMMLMKDELVSIDKLEQIIENDPAISAKILSVSNSPYFGSTSSTTTLDNAIMRVGFNNVKDIALGISMMTVFENKKGVNIIDYQRVFNHSIAVGYMAKQIANELKLNFAAEIMFNGLLHDLGFLLLNKYFPDNYGEVIKEFQKEKSLLKAEEKVLKFNHADIGAWLVETWNLPKSVLATTLYHHSPSSATRNSRQVAVTHIADYISSKNIMGPISDDPNYPLDSSSLEILGLSEDDLIELEERLTGGYTQE